jgi:glycosyltransferase involved in cell wall biosynthesis
MVQETFDSDLLPVSVIICTYSENRWNDLQKTINALLPQARDKHEIIVICDHNPDLLQKIRIKYPTITISPNRSKQGLSGARNTGISLAHKPILAFIDDDAVPQSNWIENLSKHYSKQGVVGVGGKIIPNWEIERPNWLPEEFDWVVGCTYLGMPRESTQVSRLIGCNMSFHRSVFDAVGEFTESLGRIGTIPMAGEETEFCMRVGEIMPDSCLIYDPSIAVSHLVPIQRTSFKYFLSRSFAEGLSKAILAKRMNRRVSFNTERVYTFKILPSGFFRYVSKIEIRRSVVIVIGLFVTGAGFFLGLLTPKSEERTTS